VVLMCVVRRGSSRARLQVQGGGGRAFRSGTLGAEAEGPHLPHPHLSIHGAPRERENVIRGSLQRREELGSRAIARQCERHCQDVCRDQVGQQPVRCPIHRRELRQLIVADVTVERLGNPAQ